MDTDAALCRLAERSDHPSAQGRSAQIQRPSFTDLPPLVQSNASCQAALPRLKEVLYLVGS
jgi:hypothetical protein